jgi:hypothetical protein
VPKFQSLNDVHLFLVEVGRVDLLNQATEDYQPPTDLLEIYIKKRKSIVPRIKDFRKSQNTKEQWRKNRYKMMKGIGRFHKSTEGKRFHRSMARFLATRSQDRSNPYKRESYSEIAEDLKALSSLRTHLYVQFEYYMSLDEVVDFEILAKEIIDASAVVESSILRFEENFTESDLDLLCRAVEPKVLHSTIASIITTDNVDSIVKKLEEYVAIEQLSYPEIIKLVLECSDSTI